MTTTETGAGFDIQVLAGLSANVGSLASQIWAERDDKQRLAQAIHHFTVPPQAVAITSNAGTLDQPNLLGPRTGKFWDIRRIAATGFTAGTVTVYMGPVGAEIVAYFSAQGVTTLGKATVLLGGNDRLVFSAATITGTVTVSIAGTEIDADRIGDYLV